MVLELHRDGQLVGLIDAIWIGPTVTIAAQCYTYAATYGIVRRPGERAYNGFPS